MLNKDGGKGFQSLECMPQQCWENNVGSILNNTIILKDKYFQ